MHDGLCNYHRVSTNLSQIAFGSKKKKKKKKKDRKKERKKERKNQRKGVAGGAVGGCGEEWGAGVVERLWAFPSTVSLAYLAELNVGL